MSAYHIPYFFETWIYLYTIDVLIQQDNKHQMISHSHHGFMLTEKCCTDISIDYLYMILINDTLSLKHKTIQKISKTVRMTKIILNMHIKSISKIYHNDRSSYYLYTHFFMTYFFYLYRYYNIIFAYSILFDKVKILFTKDFFLSTHQFNNFFVCFFHTFS